MTPQRLWTRGRRAVIVHFHLFKNAGTSVDKMLRRHFLGAWRDVEDGGSGVEALSAVRAMIRDEPDVQMISSHTAQLHPPLIKNVDIHPILFLRHPLDRVRSVYAFERRQDSNQIGARKAKELDLADYVAWRLEYRGDFTVTNFQTRRLADAAGPDGGPDLLTRARWSLKRFPFYGIVEMFEESAARLEAWLRPAFPGLRLETLRENVTHDHSESLHRRLERLHGLLGDALFAQLEAANQDDLTLYREALRAFILDDHADANQRARGFDQALLWGILHADPRPWDPLPAWRSTPRADPTVAPTADDLWRLIDKPTRGSIQAAVSNLARQPSNAVALKALARALIGAGFNQVGDHVARGDRPPDWLIARFPPQAEPIAPDPTDDTLATDQPYSLKRGAIWTGHGRRLVFDAEGCVDPRLSDADALWLSGAAAGHSAASVGARVAVVLQPAQPRFDRWLLSVLPQLARLIPAQDASGDWDAVIAPLPAEPWARSGLHAIGVDPRVAQPRARAGPVLCAEEIIFLPNPPDPGDPPTWAIAAARALFPAAEAQAGSGPPVLLWDRTLSAADQARQMRLEATVNGHGFKRLPIDGRPLDRIAEAVAQAGAVAGVAGPAMAATLFASPKTPVFEARDGRGRPMTEAIARAVGFPLTAATLNPEGGANPVEPWLDALDGLDANAAPVSDAA